MTYNSGIEKEAAEKVSDWGDKSGLFAVNEIISSLAEGMPWERRYKKKVFSAPR